MIPSGIQSSVGSEVQCYLTSDIPTLQELHFILGIFGSAVGKRTSCGAVSQLPYVIIVIRFSDMITYFRSI